MKFEGQIIFCCAIHDSHILSKYKSWLNFMFESPFCFIKLCIEYYNTHEVFLDFDVKNTLTIVLVLLHRNQSETLLMVLC